MSLTVGRQVPVLPATLPAVTVTALLVELSALAAIAVVRVLPASSGGQLRDVSCAGAGIGGESEDGGAVARRLV